MTPTKKPEAKAPAAEGSADKKAEKPKKPKKPGKTRNEPKLNEADPKIQARLDMVLDLCGMGYSRVQIIRELMKPVDKMDKAAIPAVSQGQAYRYFKRCEELILESQKKTHMKKLAEARHNLSVVYKNAMADKEYQSAIKAMDRRNLIDNVANPITSGRTKVFVAEGTPEPEQDDFPELNDEELSDIIKKGRRRSGPR